MSWFSTKAVEIANIFVVAIFVVRFVGFLNDNVKNVMGVKNIKQQQSNIHVAFNFFLKILNFLEQNSGQALDVKMQEKERKRNKRMTFVLSCIAITFVVSSLPLPLFFNLVEKKNNIS